jgi:hypothetical protein
MKSTRGKSTHRSVRRANGAFVPISIAKYLEIHAASNPGVDRADLAARLLEAVNAKLAGARCECGEPIWAIGSAVVGFACFTCMTGQAVPDQDYEIFLE